MAAKASVIFVVLFARCMARPLKVSHAQGQNLALYQGPRNYFKANQNQILPSFIITSKPLLSQNDDDFWEMSKKPGDWEPMTTYVLDCRPGQPCNQGIQIDLKDDYDDSAENSIDSWKRKPSNYYSSTTEATNYYSRTTTTTIRIQQQPPLREEELTQRGGEQQRHQIMKIFTALHWHT